MIGIIGAMRIEVETIRGRMEQTQKRVIGGMEFVSGTLHGKPVVTLVCGVGKVSAAMGAQAMILTYAPDCIINSGVGGSLHPDLRIGDLAVAEQLVQHDMDTTPLGDPPGYLYGPDCVYLKTDPAVTAALEAAAAAAGDVRCLRGTIASGDQFIADPEKKRRITETFSDVIACEMEGASIAQVCVCNGVPFGVVRAASDCADGSGHMDYAEFLPVAADRAARLIDAFVTSY
ncbi:MAG: 5'-methylthioadenosine/adenosylhomocysteine nucleosidase [Clostridia bacterium]|nr:5'-methylthioadenosine/adenosylhomocysteine nucleosidase [Clostridia bacterium]